MKIRVAQKAGFCFGVKRATDHVEALLAEGKKRVFVLGRLIHNRLYNESLEARGVRHITMQEVEEIAKTATPSSPVVAVIRAHGMPQNDERVLHGLEERYPSFSVSDMTCPFVKKIHRIAQDNTGEDTVFFLLGSEDHPEVEGILSYVKGEKCVFCSADELEEKLKKIDLIGKMPVFAAQTTQNLLEWEKTAKFIDKVWTNAKIFDTICNITRERQDEAVSLAETSDVTVVVGGHESSNTGKLYDLARAVCPHTVWVESKADLPPLAEWQDKTISITAGASTPGDIIKEIFDTMSQEISFEQMLEESLKTIHTGATVRGTVTAITDSEIFVDLGAKVTGVIARDQATADPAAKLADLFKVGDEVNTFVIHVSDKDGMATLSKIRLDADKNWLKIVEAKDSGEILEGKVVKAIKGGVILSYEGAQVFVPASHTGVARDGDLAVLVGTDQRFKVIEIDDRRKNSAKGSIRLVLNAERKEKEAAVWATLEVGQHFTGKVKSMTTYGAFVDLGGVDGMVHNTELSWKRIKNPAEVVSVGQEIEVFIKELDREAKRISLGYKTEETDPWYQFRKQYGEGAELDAKIVSMMPYGAFAEVAPGVDGLIHISQISLDRIAKPEDALTVGQVVRVAVTEVDDEKRKLSLSIKALLAEAAKEAEAAQKAEEAAEMAPYIAGQE